MALINAETSPRVLKAESEQRTNPFSAVPKASCISGAQCNPPRTAIENLSDNMQATSSELFPLRIWKNNPKR